MARYQAEIHLPGLTPVVGGVPDDVGLVAWLATTDAGPIRRDLPSAIVDLHQLQIRYYGPEGCPQDQGYVLDLESGDDVLTVVYPAPGRVDREGSYVRA